MPVYRLINPNTGRIVTTEQHDFKSAQYYLASLDSNEHGFPSRMYKRVGSIKKSKKMPYSYPRKRRSPRRRTSASSRSAAVVVIIKSPTRRTTRRRSVRKRRY